MKTVQYLTVSLSCQDWGWFSIGSTYSPTHQYLTVSQVCQIFQLWLTLRGFSWYNGRFLLERKGGRLGLVGVSTISYIYVRTLRHTKQIL